MSCIAIIPARGGSKRVPRKNIRIFCGKPMIAWSIYSALDSGLFDRVVVSTDDEEIAETATRHGAEIPFLRPQELSDDLATTRQVVIHAIKELQHQSPTIEHACCIYATAPFISSEDIRKGYRILRDSGKDFAFSVTSFSYPVQRALRLTSHGGVEMLFPEHKTTRSQDLEEVYHDAGQFYWGRIDAFLANRPTFSDSSRPIILPRYRVHDIDTEEDWQEAELMFEALLNRQNPKAGAS